MSKLDDDIEERYSKIQERRGFRFDFSKSKREDKFAQEDSIKKAELLMENTKENKQNVLQNSVELDKLNENQADITNAFSFIDSLELTPNTSIAIGYLIAIKREGQKEELLKKAINKLKEELENV